MKLAFWRKKTKSAPPQEHKETPLSVILSPSAENAEELYAVLPEHSEVFLQAGQTPPDTTFLLDFKTGGTPSGKYILFLDAEIRASGAAELVASLSVREEELILCHTEGERAANAPTAEQLFQKETAFSPHKYICALSRALYERLGAISQTAEMTDPDAHIFAPLLLAESTAILTIGTLKRKKVLHSPNKKEELFALVRFFNDIKANLSAEKYRFAFNYICERAVQTYAFFADKNDGISLQETDTFLKDENMALRVAANERAPFGFIAALRKNGYRAPLWLKPAVTLVARRKK